jgi:TfoX/Sxy family transcriptional regulator of competence genes
LNRVRPDVASYREDETRLTWETWQRQGKDGYDHRVAFDEDLATRIRELIGPERKLTEKRMFGGLAFLVGGNMAIAASGQGGILVRADPAKSEALVEKTNAEFAVMRGRPMSGWLRVDTEYLRTKRELARWVEIGTAYAGSLPAKR